MKRSTREFIREARRSSGQRRYTLWDLLHGYVYMRWPFVYISIGKGDHPLSQLWKRMAVWLKPLKKVAPIKTTSAGIAAGYHGKALSLETARQLVSVKQAICLENLEQVIPFERARDIILRNPDHIVALDCPCRKSKENPCLPLDVCLIIGEPFASFVLEHHPTVSRALTPAEARQVLEEEAARGHVHHAFFKDAMLNRFYAICNCCACCCGAMQAQRNGTPMIISSGYIAQIDKAACAQCGACVRVCPFQAVYFTEDGCWVDQGACMGCGVCVHHCPYGALELVRDASKPHPLTVAMLTEG